VPGNPYVVRALDALQASADRAEKGGDKALARRALEAMRAALLGTRSFYTPHGERLPGIEGRLARLYAESEGSARVGAVESVEARTAWHRERLGRRPGPATLPVMLALGGLALWLGAALAFFFKGLDPLLRLRTGRAIAAGVAFLIGFAMFVAGLRLA
jgi:hypothetical protein